MNITHAPDRLNRSPGRRADSMLVLLRRFGRKAHGNADDAATSILHEARVVGLRSLQQPSIADIERRRTEVWLLMGTLVTICVAGGTVLSFWPSVFPWWSGVALKVCVLGLVLVAALYSAGKERHLRQLTRLLFDERVLTTALTDRLHEIGSLLEAGAAVNSAHELDKVLDIILGRAIDLLGGSGGSILRREGDVLIVITTLGVGDRVGTRVLIGEGAAGRAARIRETLLLLDNPERSASGGAESHTEPGSTMAVPMIDRDDLLGALVVHAPPGRDLSEYDMRAAKLFAASAASAISKAELLAAARAQAAELEHAAYHDPLTGLANRSMFADQVEEALSRTRAAGRITAVLYMDLDGFKTVNDRLGHTSGDMLLAAVAERLRRSLRTGAHAARLGGDEFAVLLGDVDDIAVATIVAQRILASVNRPYSLDGREAQVTASIGIAHAGPEDTEATWGTLVGGADLAMYEAKRRQRGSIPIFDPEMSNDAATRRELRSRFEHGLESGEIHLQYQPVVNMDDGRVVSAEALVRWAHPDHGLLTPDVFLPLAVETGAIVALGRVVLRDACMQLAQWQRKYGNAAPSSIAVNVSPRQLDSGSLIDDVKDALDISGLRGDALLLELTEDAIVSEDDSVTRTLGDLRRIGVRIAIDDFGARYSALGYLLRLPVDVLKADKSFIDGLGRSDESAALVRTVVELARRLQLETIAEGVETPEQAQVLVDLGCRLAQGFYFSRPLPAADFDKVLSGGPRPMAAQIPKPRHRVHDELQARVS